MKGTSDSPERGILDTSVIIAGDVAQHLRLRRARGLVDIVAL